MATEQGHNIGQLSTLVDRNDSKGATTAGLPIDRKVLGVGLDQVRVPSILRDAEIVVTLLLFGQGPLERDTADGESCNQSERYHTFLVDCPKTCPG